MNLSEQKHELAKKISKNHGLKPKTKADMVLSKRHLKDSIGYNLRHAKDHLHLAAVDEKLLHKRDRPPSAGKKNY